MNPLPAAHLATLARFNLDGDLYAATRRAKDAMSDAADLSIETDAASKTATRPLRSWIARRANKAMGGGYLDAHDVEVKAWSNYQPSDPRHVAFPRVTVTFGQHPRLIASWTPSDGDLGAWIDRMGAAWKVARG